MNGWVQFLVGLSLVNTGGLSLLHYRVRRIEQPLTRAEQLAMDGAIAVARAAEADYRVRVKRRRSDKDTRQLAAERALDALRRSGVEDER